jgi:hypothetical protein
MWGRAKAAKAKNTKRSPRKKTASLTNLVFEGLLMFPSGCDMEAQVVNDETPRKSTLPSLQA